jgi:hypothetical protein
VWYWVAGGILSLDSLRKVHIWVDRGGPDRRRMRDEVLILNPVRYIFGRVQIPLHLRVRVSVPIDEIDPLDALAVEGVDDKRYSIIRRGASH